jgi:adenosylcobinamide kinase / adenosylcobinamide-phosphate guanylyltransferase
MGLVLLLGGARSGKSALAVRLAEAAARPVVFLATAQAGDDEMAERIRLHREARPPAWTTVEEPLELRRAIAEAPAETVVVVDCLSLWVANAIEHGRTEAEIDEEAEHAAAEAARRERTIAVSNEVGLGVVPATPLGRAYRDVLGRVNATWAGAAEDAALVVAGRVLALAEPPGHLGG